MNRAATLRRVRAQMCRSDTPGVWRTLAHNAFDQLWLEAYMGRSAAYRWLAENMNLPKNLCHMARFDAEQCQQVIRLATKKMKELRTMREAGRETLEKFEERFGPAGKPLSMLIRPAIVAPEGRTLVWGDWSSIEARTLPWLADSPGSREVLEVFRQSDIDPDAPDIYEIEAANIRGKSPEDVDEDERQEGKVAVLSLGFGGARGALQAMATGYGLSIPDAKADEIVRKWRDRNTWARDFWNQLWEAFLDAMQNPGAITQAGRVCFLYQKEYMNTVHMFLPDGRPISYPGLRWGIHTRTNELGEEEERRALLYRRGDERRALWYGTLAENPTQGIAGSRLREALTVLSPAPQLGPHGEELPVDAPAEVVGHTHDEIICECDDTPEAVEATRKWLGAEMTRVPEWMEGCPMAADLSTNFYYTKAKGVATKLSAA